MLTAQDDQEPRDEKGSFSGGRLQPVDSALADFVGVQAGSVPMLLIAGACYRCTVDWEGAAAGWRWGWVLKVVLRDLLLMGVVAGGWDWLLHFSPLAERLGPFKFNRKYPPASQLRRDVAWTTSATLLSSLQEVLFMRYWASGSLTRTLFGALSAPGFSIPTFPFFAESAEAAIWSLQLPMVGDLHFHDRTAGFIAWIVTMLYWRISHFYLIHRAMHPWWDRKSGLLSGDIGAFLYRHVHSHHHKSYNPTAWSGISMHPVESTAYFSAALIPLCFRSGRHPFLHLYTKLDLAIGAMIGHDGFDAPGGGSYFHQLHHAHFEVNYGDKAGIPWDWIFGSFSDGTEYRRSSVEGGQKAQPSKEGHLD